MTEQDEREAYNEELRQQAENDSTHIPASGRQQAGEMLREARRGWTLRIQTAEQKERGNR